MEQRFRWHELSGDALMRHGVGRTIVEAGAAPDFAAVPFAGQVGDWVVPGERFLWVRFDDGVFWLIGPRGDKERYFLVDPAGSQGTKGDNP